MKRRRIPWIALLTAALLAPTFLPGALAGQTEPTIPLEPYADIRYFTEWGDEQAFAPGEFSPGDIPTFTFNEGTVLAGSEDIACEVMEKGKNPGLGVRSLHARGVTGAGVNVAIIDQPMVQNHPEFDGKIAAYFDTGTDAPEWQGSMHGPAVMSLLAGETIGTAPGVKAYYAAAPSWKADSQYFADALLWIVEQNGALPEGEKIRVVSISAAPSGEGSPFKKNHAAYDDAVQKAQDAGILVLDCRNDPSTGRIAAGYYDLDAPDDASRFMIGWPHYPPPDRAASGYDHMVSAPASRRTVAEQYTVDRASYQYQGIGGLSWAIPYVVGVLALGWQVNPDLSPDEIFQILLDTAAKDEFGHRIVNPAAFVEAIEDQ